MGEWQAHGVVARTNQCFGVIQAGGLDPHESLAWPWWSQFLQPNLYDLRTAGAKSASNSTMCDWDHS
jgi:hypothetical protein